MHIPCRDENDCTNQSESAHEKCCSAKKNSLNSKTKPPKIFSKKRFNRNNIVIELATHPSIRREENHGKHTQQELDMLVILSRYSSCR